MNTYTDLDTWMARRGFALKAFHHWRVKSTDNRTLCGVSVQPADVYSTVTSLETRRREGRSIQDFPYGNIPLCRECQEKALRLQTVLSRMGELEA